MQAVYLFNDVYYNKRWKQSSDIKKILNLEKLGNADVVANPVNEKPLKEVRREQPKSFKTHYQNKTILSECFFIARLYKTLQN